LLHLFGISPKYNVMSHKQVITLVVRSGYLPALKLRIVRKEAFPTGRPHGVQGVFESIAD
jgi:hypothetical protein